MKKKKVLFIAKNIPIPERLLGNKIIYIIAEKLSLNSEISFFFPKSRVPWGMHLIKKYRPLFRLKDWTFDGFKVFVISYVQLPGLLSTYWLFNRLPKKAEQKFADGQYDLIHAHYGMPDGYLAYLLSEKFGIPYILTLRTHDIRYLSKLKKWNPDYKKYTKVLDNASKILVTNGALKDYFLRLGYSSNIMPHGIDIIPPFNKRKSNSISIVCVSKYLKRKNVEWVIDAVREYSGNKDIKLMLLGDMKDLPIEYKQKCVNNISLVGQVSNSQVQQILCHSDIFALPSVIETFGLVYLEAASAGCAIIGHENEGVWGVFENKKEMLFPENFDSFKSLLYKLIEDDTYRHELQAMAYSRAKTMTWDKIANDYNELYSELLREC